MFSWNRKLESLVVFLSVIVVRSKSTAVRIPIVVCERKVQIRSHTCLLICTLL